VRSADLLAHRIVDRVIEEGDDDAAFLASLGNALGAELAALRTQDPAARMTGRRARYRNLGLSVPGDTMNT
jgi:acetyl-CoA carboxylase carboxyl transferase subunit beta